MRNKKRKTADVDPSTTGPTEKSMALKGLAKPATGKTTENQQVLIQCLRMIGKIEDAIHNIETDDQVSIEHARQGLRIARGTLSDTLLWDLETTDVG